MAEIIKEIIWIHVKIGNLMNHEHHLEKRALPVFSPTQLRYDRQQLCCHGNQEDEPCAGDVRWEAERWGWGVRCGRIFMSQEHVQRT